MAKGSKNLTVAGFIALVMASSGVVHGAEVKDQQGRGRLMTPAQALVLGIIEGVTEYLPISSTGHLLVAQKLMGIGGWTGTRQGDDRTRKEATDAYAICIQGGAIMAVLGLYRGRIRSVIMGLIGRDPKGVALLWRLVAAFVPAAVLGATLEGSIKERLFGPWPVVLAWAIGGAFLIWFPRGRMRAGEGTPIEGMSLADAVIIGLVQCVAMWPGVSRSLATIVGGLGVGLSLSASVEFSFLLGVITLGAATAFDFIKHGQAMIQVLDPWSMGIGFASALVSAVIAVKWMVSYLQSHGLQAFGYYRVGVSLVVSALLLSGVI